MTLPTYNLSTEAGDSLNGKTFTDLGEMLSAVRTVYGEACDFGVSEGVILDANEELVATFGEAV